MCFINVIMSHTRYSWSSSLYPAIAHGFRDTPYVLCIVFLVERPDKQMRVVAAEIVEDDRDMFRDLILQIAVVVRCALIKTCVVAVVSNLSILGRVILNGVMQIDILLLLCTLFLAPL